MFIKNCTDLAQCLLGSAYCRYNDKDSFRGKINEALPLGFDQFRTIGIALNVITSIGAYFVLFSKVEFRGQNYQEIEGSSRLSPHYWDTTLCLFSPIVIGFQFAYLIPMTTFFAPDFRWRYFQSEMNLLKYGSICKNETLFEEGALTKQFYPIASSLISETNHSLNRPALVLGGTSIGVTLLLGIEILFSCYQHKRILKRDVVALIGVIGLLIFSIFSLSRARAIDVKPVLNSGWTDCLKDHNQTEVIWA